MKPQRTLLLQPQAPAKPDPGAACNGCGVCCSAEPCPIGRWLSRRAGGRCAALLWVEGQARYRCGALAEPARWWPWLPAGLASRLAGRWIAAGHGCDCDYLARPASAAGATPAHVP